MIMRAFDGHGDDDGDVCDDDGDVCDDVGCSNEDG